MEYISVAEAAEKWDVSVRQVQRLLAHNRITGAKKYGRSWMIPNDAEKPVDPRKESKPAEVSLHDKLADVIEATSASMPIHNPDEIISIVKDEMVRLQYEAELSYLRGNFARVLRCYDKTEKNEAARLRASLVAVAAAISMGDYPAYLKIEAYLKKYMETDHR